LWADAPGIAKSSLMSQNAQAAGGPWITVVLSSPRTELIRCNPNSGIYSKESDELASWLVTLQP